MWYYTLLTLLIIGLFFLLLFIIHLGKVVSSKISINDGKELAGTGLVEGAIFTLLGLLITFTFYGASQRFDVRREIIVNETNAIGTAWLRLDLLTNQAQAQIRPIFKQYVQARLNTNQFLPDIPASKQQMAIANELQGTLWRSAITALQQNSTPTVAMVVLPALNEMFDIATTHNTSLITHPPSIIFIMLVLLLCSSAFFIGFSMACNKHILWLHGIGYSLIMVLVLYVIIDFEFPRAGFITVSKFDQTLLELNQKIQSYQGSTSP